MNKLKIGKDYISKDGLIVLDRTGDTTNRGIDGNNFEYDLFCSSPYVWREATEEEVIGAFRKHLIHRYGNDWKTMKIKERHPSSKGNINDELWAVLIAKVDSWSVWNENGLLYRNGIWVERLEEPPKLTDGLLSPEDIKEIKAGEKADKRYVLKKDVLTILSVESKFNPDKKLSEYLEQFKLILEVL